MAEFAGKLSERLRFEQRSGARGLFGEQSAIWKFAFECWGEVKPLGRADPLPVAADTRHVARRWRLVMRDRRHRPSFDMRVTWRDQTLAIIGIDTDPRQPGWLTLLAEDFAPAGR